MKIDDSPPLADLTAAISMAFESALNTEIEGIFASIFFVLTFVTLGSMLYQLRIRRWPTTTGKLLAAGTRKFGPTEIVPSDVNYINAVSYEYSVGGKKYVGRRYSPWIVLATHNLKAILQHQIKDLMPEEPIVVLYNPDDPQKSFLKRPGIVGLFITFGCAVFCFFTPMLVFA